MQECLENTPVLWLPHFPWVKEDGHKYQRGHAVVQGGGISHTGAGRLAARGALRMGAGAVTIFCDRQSLPVYAADARAVMTRPIETENDFHDTLGDARITGFLIGPAAGVHDQTRNRVLAALSLDKPVVLDADALTVFASDPTPLFAAIASIPTILTPHEGEFARLFALEGDREARAAQAARISGAVVVLKGANTFIAAPDGRLAINRVSAPHLATAGSGDVLAGMALGLLAAGMPAFEVACAAVWLHAQAGASFGPGLIADDLPDLLPPLLQSLYQKRNV